MEALSGMRCEECRSGGPTLTEEEIADLQSQVPDWQVVERDGVPQLERIYEFPDFVQALAFANRVGEIAEEEAHHPALLVEWGRVTVTWWTHTVGGLHRNDFIMAAKTDAVARSDQHPPLQP